MIKKTWETPQGSYYNLFSDMLKPPHLLVAGATGSGKSVVINGIITTALKDSPAAVQFIFIDPKRVELVEYKPLPHTLKYASEPGDMVQALQYAMDTTESRYKAMQSRHEKNYSGGAVYVVIDELADLMTTNRKQVQPLIQRLWCVSATGFSTLKVSTSDLIILFTFIVLSSTCTAYRIFLDTRFQTSCGFPHL